MSDVLIGALFVIAFGLGLLAYEPNDPWQMAMAMVGGPVLLLLVRRWLPRFHKAMDLLLLVTIAFFAIAFLDDVDAGGKKADLLWSGMGVHAVNFALILARWMARAVEARAPARVASGMLLRGLMVIATLGALLLLRFGTVLDRTLGFGLLSIAAGLGRWARRVTQPSAADLLQADPRAPILLLRPFDVDEAEIGRRFDWRQLIMLHPEFWRSRTRWTFEEEITKGLEALGPAIAVGRPGESVAPAGAARTYVDHASWRPTVERLVDAASLVVIVLGDTPGLRWEVNCVLDRTPLQQLVLLLPPQLKTESVEPIWTRLRADIPGLAALDPTRPCVAFDSDGHSRGFGSLRDLVIEEGATLGSGDAAAALAVLGESPSLFSARLRTPKTLRRLAATTIYICAAVAALVWFEFRDRSIATTTLSSGSGRALVVSPNGGLIAAIGWDDSRVEVRTTDTLALVQRLSCDAAGGRQPLAFLGGGGTLACAETTRVRLIDAKTGKLGKVLEAPGPVEAIAAAGEHGLVAAYCRFRDGFRCGGSSVIHWRNGNVEEPTVVWTGDREVEQVVVSPDGQQLVVVFWTYSPVLVDIGAADAAVVGAFEVEGSFESFDGPADWSAGGLAVASFRQALVWTVDEIRLRYRLQTDDELKLACALSPDGEQLALASYESSRVRLWSVTSGERTADWAGHGDSVEALAFTPDGTTLLSLDKSGTLKAWALR